MRFPVSSIELERHDAFLGRAPQIERSWIFERDFERRSVDHPAGMAVILEAGAPAPFGLIGIDRKGLVIAPTWMRHVIDAATERAPVPGVDDVESQWRVNAGCRL